MESLPCGLFCFNIKIELILKYYEDFSGKFLYHQYNDKPIFQCYIGCIERKADKKESEKGKDYDDSNDNQ